MFGYLLELMLIAAISLLAWQVHSLNQLYLWVKNPRKYPLPDTAGQVYQLHRELNKSIQSNSNRKKQITNFLTQFRKAAAVLPDSIVLIDQYGKIQWANRNSEKLLGIRWPADANVRFADLVRDPALSKVLSPQPLLPDQDARVGLEFSSPLNREQTLNIRSFPYSDDLVMIVIRDVSRLVKINAMHKDFVANVSHELKTPLTVLRGYLEIMIEKTNAPVEPDTLDSFAMPLEQMSMQSNRMQLLVNDLLFLSKLEDSQFKQTQELVIIDALVNSILESLEPKIRAQEIEVKITLAPDLIIQGSHRELYSALSNLIDNALNYTSHRGTIEIASQINSDLSASIRVKDDGVGIANSQIPRLTERFYRIDDDRSRDGGGTGLGLAIVKHVLQRHDAVLEIESKLGSGSSFNCTFPAHRRIDK
jgi:two-component system phosphate regulon sensor histidine kinase PhoR